MLNTGLPPYPRKRETHVHAETWKLEHQRLQQRYAGEAEAETTEIHTNDKQTKNATGAHDGIACT